MPVATVVVMLTEVVTEECAVMSAWEQSLARELRSMPIHLEQRNLGWWEARYQHVRANGPEAEMQIPGTAARLLDQIFEFGRFNLYSEFDRRQAQEKYETLIRSLNTMLATTLRADQDVSDF